MKGTSQPSEGSDKKDSKMESLDQCPKAREYNAQLIGDLLGGLLLRDLLVIRGSDEDFLETLDIRVVAPDLLVDLLDGKLNPAGLTFGLLRPHSPDEQYSKDEEHPKESSDTSTQDESNDRSLMGLQHRKGLVQPREEVSVSPMMTVAMMVALGMTMVGAGVMERRMGEFTVIRERLGRSPSPLDFTFRRGSGMVRVRVMMVVMGMELDRRKADELSEGVGEFQPLRLQPHQSSLLASMSLRLRLHEVEMERFGTFGLFFRDGESRENRKSLFLLSDEITS